MSAIQTNGKNRVQEAAPAVTPMTKTPEQRRAELKAALAAMPARTKQSARRRPEMPQEVKELAGLVEGLSFGEVRQLAATDKEIADTVPDSITWDGYTSDKTNKDSFTVGDGRFSGGLVLARRGQWVMTIKTSIQIYASNK